MARCGLSRRLGFDLFILDVFMIISSFTNLARPIDYLESYM